MEGRKENYSSFLSAEAVRFDRNMGDGQMLDSLGHEMMHVVMILLMGVTVTRQPIMTSTAVFLCLLVPDSQGLRCSSCRRSKYIVPQG